MPHARENKSATYPEFPIDATDVSPITDVTKKEDVLGYLGFSSGNKETLQNIVLHPFFLKYFLLLDPHMEGDRLKLKRGATFDQLLPHLRSIYKNPKDPKHKISRSPQELSQKLKTMSADEGYLPYLAALLWHWEQEVDQLNRDAAVTEEKDDDKEIFDQFATYKGMPIPDELHYKLKDLPTGLQWTVMEATNNGETRLEVCNRLWNLLWLARQQLFTGSTIARTLQPPTNRSQKYPHCELPKWWKGKELVNPVDLAKDMAQSRAQARGPVQTLKPFREISDIQAKIRPEGPMKKWRRHEKKIIDDASKQAVQSPMATKVTISNPCSCQSMEMWRDNIRMKLHLEDLEADIGTISMQPRGDSVDDEDEDEEDFSFDRYDIYGSEGAWSHDKVHAELQDEKIKSVEFDIVLNYPAKVQWESTEVPLSVQGKLALRNNDVVRVDEPASIPPPRVVPGHSEAPPRRTTESAAAPCTGPALSHAQPAPVSPNLDNTSEKPFQSPVAKADGANLDNGLTPTVSHQLTVDNAANGQDLTVSTSLEHHAAERYTPAASREREVMPVLRSRSTEAVDAPEDTGAVPIVEDRDQTTTTTPPETTDPQREAWQKHESTKDKSSNLDLLGQFVATPFPTPLHKPAHTTYVSLTDEAKGVTSKKSKKETQKSKQKNAQYLDDDDDDDMPHDPLHKMLAAAKKQKHHHKWAIPNGRKYPNLNQKRTPQDDRALDPQKRDDATYNTQVYEDFDVDTPGGLFTWIRSLVDTVAPGPATTAVYQPKGRLDENDEYVDVAEGVQKQYEKSALQADPEMRPEKQQTNEDSALYQSQMTVDHRVIEAALSGAQGFVGPPLDACLKLLGLSEVSRLRDTEVRQYRSEEFMPGVKTALLPTQVTGMVHMLLRTCGKFPLSAKQQEPQHQAHFQQIAKDLTDELKPPRIMGGLLSDGAGMGKTATACAFFDWLGSHSVPQDGKYRPGLLLVPDGVVVNQWAELINDNFPEIELFVAKSGGYKERQRKGGVNRWKSLRAKDMKNMKKFPHKWIFDTSNPRAAKAMLLVSYATWRKRTGLKIKLPPEQQKLEKDELPDNVIKDKKDKFYKENTVADVWQDVFGVAIFDEAHVLRRDTSLLHWVARTLRAKVNWLLTATPLVNNGDDLVNEARLLWREAKQLIKADPAWRNWKTKYKKANEGPTPWTLWKEVEEQTAATSPLRLIALRPQSLQQLLSCGDLNAIGSYYQIHANLLLLRRTPESRLPGHEAGADGTLHLDKIMRPHHVVTVPLTHRSREEEREFLMWHRIGSLLYQEICRKHAASKNEDPSGKDQGPPPVAPAFRIMAMATASTKLAEFDDWIVNNTYGSTKVESLATFRDMQISADTFLWLLSNGEDLDAKTRRQLLAILLHGSEKGKEMLRHVRDHMLPKPGEKQAFKKLLITEEFPLIAWFWELILTYLHIPVQVLHSGLEQHEREKVVAEFNRAPAEGEIHNCSVLIMMYSINAAGVNLHHDCHRCIVTTPSTTAALEIQAYSRLIRVAQEKDVLVVRFCLKNSHDEYRDAMQANKVLIDSAMKTYTPETKQTLLDLLNTYGKEEAEAILKNSFLGQTVMHYLGKAGKPSTQAAVMDALKDNGIDPDGFEALLNEDSEDGDAPTLDKSAGVDVSNNPDAHADSPLRRHSVNDSTEGGEARSSLIQPTAIPPQDNQSPSEQAIDSDARGQDEASATVTGPSRTSETSLQAEIEEFWAKLELLDELDHAALATRMLDCVTNDGLVTDHDEVQAILSSFRLLLETADILDRAESVDAPGAVGNEEPRPQVGEGEARSKLSRSPALSAANSQESPSPEGSQIDEDDEMPDTNEPDSSGSDKNDHDYQEASSSESSDEAELSSDDDAVSVLSEVDSGKPHDDEARRARISVQRLPELPGLHMTSDELQELTKSNATAMTRPWKKFWQDKLNQDTRQTFNQDVLYTVYLAKQQYPYKDDYTLEDLENDAMLLERALRLMHRRRFGQAYASLRISPLIDYSKLPETEQQGLMNKIRAERKEEEIDLVTKVFGVRKRGQRTFEPRRSPVIPAPPLSAKEQQAERDRETKALRDQRKLHEERKAHKDLRARSKKENARQNEVSIAPATFMNSSHKIILNPHTSLGKSLADAEDSARDEVVRLLKKTDATDFQAKAYKSVFGKHRDFSELHRIRKDLGLLVEEAADGEEYDGDVDEDGGGVDSVEVEKPFMEDEPVMPLEVFDQGPGGEDEAGTKRESDEDVKGESDDLI